MNCRDKPARTWYGLIRAALEEDAARSALNSGQIQALTARLKKDGYTVKSYPRTTGDGYYESCIYDMDNNSIEITA